MASITYTERVEAAARIAHQHAQCAPVEFYDKIWLAIFKALENDDFRTVEPERKLGEHGVLG